MPARPTRSHEIAGRLARRILSKGTGPGTRLPTEREMAAEYGTTRNVIREAIRRLEAVGLVDVLRGSGTYVGNPQFSAGIELFDVLVTREDGSINEAFLRDVLEFRAYAFRLMVQLASVRRSEEELAHIRRLVEERETLERDSEALSDVTVGLFREIAYATHNQVCQLMFNTVQRISLRLRTLVDLQFLTFEESQSVFRRLVDAFEHKDAAMAELVVIRYNQAVERSLNLGLVSTEFVHL
ncbi:MAG TPA: GntR family transcriptional regulator [Candidatus Hydrogenedentes bacterium]|nr:GntR family transcriptional regulator [Candidatus Hydrogenedentota bacterium]